MNATAIWISNIENIEHSENRIDRFLLNLIQNKNGSWHRKNEIELHDTDSILNSLSRSQIQTLLNNELIKYSHYSPIEVEDEKKFETLHSKSSIPKNGYILIYFPKPKTLDLTPKNIPIEIVYQDSDIAVINKPQGISVHPSSSELSDTLVNFLLYHITDLSSIGGVQRPGIVHRIDKNTSGAIVIAKTNIAHQNLSKLFSNHDIQRKYWAICYGTPKALSGTIESTLGRHPGDRKKIASNVKNGKKAITLYKVIEKYCIQGKPFASLIEATLHTGRTHQVRVHLSDNGCSLFGDTLYGIPNQTQAKWKNIPRDIQNLISKLPGQALHAKILGFKHPTQANELFFEVPPPHLFNLLLDGLRKYLC